MKPILIARINPLFVIFEVNIVFFYLFPFHLTFGIKVHTLTQTFKIIKNYVVKLFCEMFEPDLLSVSIPLARSHGQLITKFLRCTRQASIMAKLLIGTVLLTCHPKHRTLCGHPFSLDDSAVLLVNGALVLKLNRIKHSKYWLRIVITRV